MNATPVHIDGLPACISLSFEFNQHAVYYQSVEQWLSDEMGGERFDWVSDTEKSIAIAENRVWTCQWYPITPVGFCTLAASSLDALMNYFRENPQAGSR